MPAGQLDTALRSRAQEADEAELTLLQKLKLVYGLADGHASDASRYEATLTMFSATFTFAKGDYDDEFHNRDQAIAQVAKSIPGYLGEEAWENPATGLISTVYYWQTLESLQRLVDHPMHQAAKERQSRWIRGYHITIAQVLRSYGDGGIGHPLCGSCSGHE